MLISANGRAVQSQVSEARIWCKPAPRLSLTKAGRSQAARRAGRRRSRPRRRCWSPGSRIGARGPQRRRRRAAWRSRPPRGRPAWARAAGGRRDSTPRPSSSSPRKARERRAMRAAPRCGPLSIERGDLLSLFEVQETRESLGQEYAAAALRPQSNIASAPMLGSCTSSPAYCEQLGRRWRRSSRRESRSVTDPGRAGTAVDRAAGAGPRREPLRGHRGARRRPRTT